MKIGNIIHNCELVNHKKVEYLNYYEGDYSNNKDINFDIPTLFVGWSFFKNNSGNTEINILNKEVIANKLYWEFSFDEDKKNHVTGIENFTLQAPKKYFTLQYNFQNIDPVFNNIRSFDDLKNILPSILIKTYELKNKTLYLLDNENNIYGIDINVFNFFEFKIDDMKNFLKNKSKNYIEDPDGIYQKEYSKIFPDFSYLNRYLVVLVTI